MAHRRTSSKHGIIRLIVPAQYTRSSRLIHTPAPADSAGVVTFSVALPITTSTCFGALRFRPYDMLGNSAYTESLFAKSRIAPC